MTPQEKAEELYQKFYNNYGYYGMPADAIIHSKQCALIAVDEIIESREEDGHFDDKLLYTGSDYFTVHPMYLTYWLQVKEEIEKL